MHTLVCVCAYNILLSTRVLVCERITAMHIMHTSVLVIIVGASQSRNKVEQYQDKEPLVLTHHHATSFLRIITTLVLLSTSSRSMCILSMHIIIII